MADDDKIKKRIPPRLWYKYFFKSPRKPQFNSVQLPKIKKPFK